MRVAYRRWIGAGLLVVGAAACGRNRVETDVDPNAPISLVVDNLAFPDMTIYVLEGSRRVRLGMATGLKKTQFVLPKYLVRSMVALRFQADPIGSNRAPISQEITVSPGDTVTLQIPPA